MMCTNVFSGIFRKSLTLKTLYDILNALQKYVFKYIIERNKRYE